MATLEADPPKIWKILVRVKNRDFVSDIMHSDPPITNLIPLLENPNVATEKKNEYEN